MFSLIRIDDRLTDTTNSNPTSIKSCQPDQAPDNTAIAAFKTIASAQADKVISTQPNKPSKVANTPQTPVPNTVIDNYTIPSYDPQIVDPVSTVLTKENATTVYNFLNRLRISIYHNRPLQIIDSTFFQYLVQLIPMVEDSSEENTLVTESDQLEVENSQAMPQTQEIVDKNTIFRTLEKELKDLDEFDGIMQLCSQAAQIDLTDYPLNNKKFYILLYLIQHSVKLLTLKLSNCQLTDRQIEELSVTLANLAENRNYLTLSTAKTVKPNQLLQQNPLICLQNLDLSKNEITQHGLYTLASVLYTMPILQILNLEKNKINPKSLIKIQRHSKLVPNELLWGISSISQELDLKLDLQAVDPHLKFTLLAESLTNRRSNPIQPEQRIASSINNQPYAKKQINFRFANIISKLDFTPGLELDPNPLENWKRYKPDNENKLHLANDDDYLTLRGSFIESKSNETRRNPNLIVPSEIYCKALPILNEQQQMYLMLPECILEKLKSDHREPESNYRLSIDYIQTKTAIGETVQSDLPKIPDQRLAIAIIDTINQYLSDIQDNEVDPKAQISHKKMLKNCFDRREQENLTQNIIVKSLLELIAYKHEQIYATYFTTLVPKKQIVESDSLPKTELPESNAISQVTKSYDENTRQYSKEVANILLMNYLNQDPSQTIIDFLTILRSNLLDYGKFIYDSEQKSDDFILHLLEQKQIQNQLPRIDKSTADANKFHAISSSQKSI